MTIRYHYHAPAALDHTCRKCGGQMSEGIATGQTHVGSIPDFPSDSHLSTFSAGGPGEIITARKCSLCGWSVTA